MPLNAPTGRPTVMEARPLTLLSTNSLTESMLATVEEFSNVSKIAGTLQALPTATSNATSATTTSQVTQQPTFGNC